MFKLVFCSASSTELDFFNARPEALLYSWVEATVHVNWLPQGAIEATVALKSLLDYAFDLTGPSKSLLGYAFNSIVPVSTSKSLHCLKLYFGAVRRLYDFL